MYDLRIDPYIDACPICKTAKYICVEAVCGTVQVYCYQCNTATSMDIRYRLICDAVADWNDRCIVVWDDVAEEYVDYKPVLDKYLCGQ